MTIHHYARSNLEKPDPRISCGAKPNEEVRQLTDIFWQMSVLKWKNWWAAGIPVPGQRQLLASLHGATTAVRQNSRRGMFSVSHESSRELSQLLWLLYTTSPFSLELKQMFWVIMKKIWCFLPQCICHTTISSATVRKSARHQAELLPRKAAEQIPPNQTCQAAAGLFAMRSYF